MFLVKKPRLRSGIFRELNTSQNCCANHYDILGITPKATQNDIKTAYYNLSKIYHPDKSKDEESAKKFRAITEAYEVLGNVNLKKMYDKGLLVGQSNSRMHYKPEAEPTDPTLKFYKSRTKRQVSHFTASGRAQTYDFDAWSANHYGEVFKKSQEEKQRSRTVIMKNRMQNINRDSENFAYLVLFVLVSIIFLTFHETSSFDKDKLRNMNKKPPEASK